MRYRFSVPPEGPVSLACFLQDRLRLSLEKARDLVSFGAVYVQGKMEQDVDRLLQPGQEVRVHIPRYGTRRFYEVNPDRILYRDDWLLAYDKQAGIPCQQTPYDAYNNVYAGLKRLLNSSSSTSGNRDLQRKNLVSGYLGMHHRLDKDVSGVMVFPLSPRANRSFSEGFRTKAVEKVYRAILSGIPDEDSWVENSSIGRRQGKYICVGEGEGKEAETGFQVIRREPRVTLVEAYPKTGRTHQIRLHLALRGLPILGDRQHEGAPYTRCMLHAFRLSLSHPISGKPLLFESPMPEAFEKALESAGCKRP